MIDCRILYRFLILAGAYLLGSHVWSSECAQLLHETGKISQDLVRRENDSREFLELSAKLRLSDDEIHTLSNPETGLFIRPIGDFPNQTLHALMNVLLRKISHHAGDRKNRINQVRFWVQDLVAYRKGKWSLRRWIDLLDPKNKGKYRELFSHLEKAGWTVKPMVTPESEKVNHSFFIDFESKKVFVNLTYLEDRPPFLIAIEIIQRVLMNSGQTLPLLFDVSTLVLLNDKIDEALKDRPSMVQGPSYFGFYVESAFAEERARVYREMRESQYVWKSQKRESPLKINDGHAGELTGVSADERKGLDQGVLDQVGSTFSEFLFRNLPR